MRLDDRARGARIFDELLLHGRTDVVVGETGADEDGRRDRERHVLEIGEMLREDRTQSGP